MLPTANDPVPHQQRPSPGRGTIDVGLIDVRRDLPERQHDLPAPVGAAQCLHDLASGLLALQAGPAARCDREDVRALEPQAALDDPLVHLTAPVVEQSVESGVVIPHHERDVVLPDPADHGPGDELERVSLPALLLRVAGSGLDVDIEADLRRFDAEPPVRDSGAQGLAVEIGGDAGDEVSGGDILLARHARAVDFDPRENVARVDRVLDDRSERGEHE